MYKSIFFLVLLTISANSQQNALNLNPEINEKYGLAIEAIFNVGLRLDALLSDSKAPLTRNFLVSPISLTLALGQLMCGADPQLQDQLFQLLQLPSVHRETILTYPNTNMSYKLNYAKLHVQLSNLVKSFDKENQADPTFVLQISSVLFANVNLQLYPKFKQYLSLYETVIEKMNFAEKPLECQKYMNDWAAAHTNNLIRTISPDVPSRSTAAIFANSVYFKADWETPFSYELSRRGNFSVTQTKQVQVTYMQGEFYIPYVENDLCRMIALPYQNNTLAMYIIVPKPGIGVEYDMKAFVQQFSAKDLLELKDKMKLRDVTLMLPKLELSNTISLLEPLKKYVLYKNASTAYRQKNPKPLGLQGTHSKTRDSFDQVEHNVNRFKNFNRPAEDIEIRLREASPDFVISNLVQQMTLSVHEKGTEAAAITSGTIDYIGGSKVVRVERPFVFFISHQATSAALFWGTIVDPTQSQKLV